jgi:hypothetical protein
MNDKLQVKPFLFQGSATLTAGSTGQISFSVPSSWDFRFTKFTFVATVSIVSVQATFDIQILNQDESLFYDYVPCDAFSGVLQNKTAVPWVRTVTNQLSNWFTFDAPYVFKARSNILVNLRNTPEHSSHYSTNPSIKNASDIYTLSSVYPAPSKASVKASVVYVTKSVMSPV